MKHELPSLPRPTTADTQWLTSDGLCPMLREPNHPSEARPKRARRDAVRYEPKAVVPESRRDFAMRAPENGETPLSKIESSLIESVDSCRFLTIVLPWPSRELSPNERKNWRIKNEMGQKAKRFAYYATREQLAKVKNAYIPNQPTLKITFHPPTKSMRDIHTMLGSISYALDGVRAAISIDDTDWILQLSRINDKAGKVVIEIELGLQ